jgi:hypothetical protein
MYPRSKRSSWSLDADAFDSWLISKIVSGGRIQLDSFRTLTLEVVATASLEARKYIDRLGVDDDDFAEDGYVHVDKWYATCMANYLAAGPSDDHIMLIWPALEVVGWSRDDIDSVITGDQLATLARTSKSQAIVNEIAPYLADRRCGGWHSPDRARELLRRLDTDWDKVEHPSPSVIKRYPPDLAAVPELLRSSLREEVKVLESGIKQGRSIRILTSY